MQPRITSFSLTVALQKVKCFASSGDSKHHFIWAGYPPDNHIHAQTEGPQEIHEGSALNGSIVCSVEPTECQWTFPAPW
ncbi:hypothetical protein CDAR_111981 [Caerostris darwini]|uniref:Uncharacterized protein n=1 Tax=Caerostris darwini TaxID=1538125 RepID=A0AAV4QWQ8_9ARAC|nr:hypothetical protein CDAR_111981 [Caerostris darwini]